MGQRAFPCDVSPSFRHGHEVLRLHDAARATRHAQACAGVPRLRRLTPPVSALLITRTRRRVSGTPSPQDTVVATALFAIVLSVMLSAIVRAVVVRCTARAYEQHARHAATQHTVGDRA